MNHDTTGTEQRLPVSTLSRRLKRRTAAVLAHCAMGSWIVLAAMPVAVVVCALY